MEAAAIIAAITQATKLAATLYEMAEDASANFSSQDQAKLKAALADIKAENDEGFARLDAKLTAAAQQ
jgi:hypothetical protein